MTIFFEISNPFLLEPSYFKSRRMYRFAWAWFAIGLLRIPFQELCETPGRWVSGNYWERDTDQ